ncbi:MAG TPA: polysaccharide deacetylase family protein [Longimicrobiales bacterium]
MHAVVLRTALAAQAGAALQPAERPRDSGIEFVAPPFEVFASLRGRVIPYALRAALALLAITCTALPPATQVTDGLTYDEGGIIRGPRDRPRIALIFTGGEYAEGADSILDVLRDRQVKASFFVTGTFIRTPAFQTHLRRIVTDGHYLGAHSDEHLLYASWSDRDETLISHERFRDDLERNLSDLEQYGLTRSQMRFFIPPYEWYNRQIVEWSHAMGLVLFNYTPGTRSNADYMPDTHPRFISSFDIYQSILAHEAADPHGLNGFLLLLHVGAGPERTDKMHLLVGPLIGELQRRGYSFVRVDELLAGAAAH